MVYHWLGIVYTYAAVGLLLICYGRLPRLIDPLSGKVLNKHAVQLQTEESQALHRGSNFMVQTQELYIHSAGKRWGQLSLTSTMYKCMHVGTLVATCF